MEQAMVPALPPVHNLDVGPQSSAATTVKEIRPQCKEVHARHRPHRGQDAPLADASLPQGALSADGGSATALVCSTAVLDHDQQARVGHRPEGHTGRSHQRHPSPGGQLSPHHGLLTVRMPAAGAQHPTGERLVNQARCALLLQSGGHHNHHRSSGAECGT